MPEPHVFDPRNWRKLDDPERREWQPVAPLLDVLDPRGGDVALDIGAGTGYVALPLARTVGPRGRVLAVDRSPRMLAELDERSRRRGVPWVYPVGASAGALPFVDATVNLAVSMNVHHEVPDPAVALSEVHRVLRPGGRFVLVDWAPGPSPTGPPQQHRIARKDIEAGLAEAGFVDVAVREPYKYHHVLEANKAR